MDKPLISIIVPVYNVAPYVEDCIRSVMRQTYDGKMECIVVDDCGTDDSMAIALRLIAEYSGPITFKVLHHTNNRGLSAARNTGMETAIGDYLFFLDSDDELTDDCIDKLVDPVNKEWYDIVLGDLEILGSVKPYLNLKLKLPNKTILRGKDIINSYRIKWNMMAQNKLYRTGFIRDSHLSFLEGLVHEDELWSFQVACLAHSLFAIQQKTYLYRIRTNGIRALSEGETRMKNLSIIVREISMFSKEKAIYNERVHQIIHGFFFVILRFYLLTPPLFKKSYKELRLFAKPSLNNLIHVDLCHIKWFLRDFHYFLPVAIAQYWVQLYIKKQIK